MVPGIPSGDCRNWGKNRDDFQCMQIQSLSQDLITGGQFVPLAKFWGTFSFLGGQKFVHPSADEKGFVFLAGLLIGLRRKSQISRNFQGQIRGKIGRLRGSFRAKLHRKAIGKKWPILWLFSRQISLEIYRFCADQTSLFNVFLTELLICTFYNNTLQK